MSRKKSRESAFKLVYQCEINKDNVLDQLKQYYTEKATDKKSKEYISHVVLGVHTNKKEIDLELTKYLAEKWTINRLSKVDLAILRLAYYEIKNVDDVPKGVAINEAIELAKMYSDDKASKFINGILANIS
ncbi:MAG: transcription antitermination factor NusB [Clostridiales bacterium]|nr:transcription antitermination factor NusB [Clostridiales bacterium]